MSDKIELNRRRVLGILITIGLAGAAMGVGTFAVFSDTEQTTNNAIQAGTLDLTIDGDNSSVQLLDVSDAVPGDRNASTVTLENVGSVDGNVNVSLANVQSEENTIWEPEAEAGDTSNGTGAGELNESQNLYVNVSVGGTWENQSLSSLSPGDDIVTGESLNAGTTTELTVLYYVPSEAGNEIQSDSLTADFNVTLSS